MGTVFDIVNSWWYWAMTLSMFVIFGEDTLEHIVEKGIQKPADALGFIVSIIIALVMAFFWWVSGPGLLLEHHFRWRRRRRRAQLRAKTQP